MCTTATTTTHTYGTSHTEQDINMKNTRALSTSSWYVYTLGSAICISLEPNIVMQYCTIGRGSVLYARYVKHAHRNGVLSFSVSTCLPHSIIFGTHGGGSSDGHFHSNIRWTLCIPCIVARCLFVSQPIFHVFSSEFFCCVPCVVCSMPYSFAADLYTEKKEQESTPGRYNIAETSNSMCTL